MSENKINEYQVLHRDGQNHQQTNVKHQTSTGLAGMTKTRLHDVQQTMKSKMQKFKKNRTAWYGVCAAIVFVLLIVAAYVIPAAKYAYDMRGKTKIALFDQVQVVFAGMSPEAYVQVQNNWEDEYLSGLQFTADPTTEIKVGELVTVTCQTSSEELKEHGFVVGTTTASFKADKLSAYANQTEQLDVEYLKKVSEEASETIVSETADTTFRMLYQATGDPAYLRTVNREEAKNIHLQQTLFLSRTNPLEGDGNNYIYMIFAADIVNEDMTMPVYFIFSYRDGYVTAEGSYEIEHDLQNQRYECSNDYDALYEKMLTEYVEIYQFVDIDL